MASSMGSEEMSRFVGDGNRKLKKAKKSCLEGVNLEFAGDMRQVYIFAVFFKCYKKMAIT